MTKTINSPWAGQANEGEKAKSNREVYEELHKKYKIVGMDEYLESDNKEQFDVVIRFIGVGYACVRYEIKVNKPELSMRECALLCDGGNLCFGYRVNFGNEITVYTD